MSLEENILWNASELCRRNADLNKKNRGGWTPLMYACYIGHDNIVNLLLDAGVNVNVKNHKGHTPLMLAASCGNESVGYFLCQVGRYFLCQVGHKSLFLCQIAISCVRRVATSSVK
jgi:ankyrin repeat protein